MVERKPLFFNLVICTQVLIEMHWRPQLRDVYFLSLFENGIFFVVCHPSEKGKQRFIDTISLILERLQNNVARKLCKAEEWLLNTSSRGFKRKPLPRFLQASATTYISDKKWVKGRDLNCLPQCEVFWEEHIHIRSRVIFWSYDLLFDPKSRNP